MSKILGIGLALVLVVAIVLIAWMVKTDRDLMPKIEINAEELVRTRGSQVERIALAQITAVRLQGERDRETGKLRELWLISANQAPAAYPFALEDAGFAVALQTLEQRLPNFNVASLRQRLADDLAKGSQTVVEWRRSG
jgi:hypothetical protein